MISLCKKCGIELDKEVPIIYGNKVLLCPECFKELLISKVLKARERFVKTKETTRVIK